MQAAGKTPLTAAWAARGGSAWLEHYWASESARHRAVIEEAVARVAPFASLVEIGSNCGPNLRRLARRWPGATYMGLEANVQAIEFARYKRTTGEFDPPGHEGLPVSVTFNQTEDFGLDVAALLDGFEVVLSCYCLAYCAPHRLRDLFGRLAESPALRALVLAEPLGDGRLYNEAPGGMFGAPIPEYHHDLEALIAEFWPTRAVARDPIDPPADGLTTVLTVEVTR